VLSTDRELSVDTIPICSNKPKMVSIASWLLKEVQNEHIESPGIIEHSCKWVFCYDHDIFNVDKCSRTELVFHSPQYMHQLWIC